MSELQATELAHALRVVVLLPSESPPELGPRPEQAKRRPQDA
jgi:hypothetical protein